MTLVLDANVVAKWLFAEPDQAKAEVLLEGWVGGKWDVVSPEILPVEIASAIWKRTLREDLPPHPALELYGQFEKFCPILVGVEPLARLALELAVAHGHSVYHCLYVALARSLSCDLVTADERLYSALGSEFPQVRLLRDWI